MRVLRGRVEDREADRAVTDRLVADTRETGEPTVRVWRPPRQVAFGRRDARDPGYDRARTAATERGYPGYERDTGGRAVAYTGNTIAFCRTEPVEEARTGIEARYDAAVDDLRDALATCGIDAERGEPDRSFCPGAHSLSADGKLVGIAQRVGSGVARVGGIVVVRDHEPIADVLDPVYDALDVPFDPGTVGSVARAQGVSPASVDAEAIRRALEDALAGGDARIERVGAGGPV
jgi:lipoate-protein ligase A